MMFRKAIGPALMAFLALLSLAVAQGPSTETGSPAPALTKAMREEAVEGLAKALIEQYVFPDKGQKMADDLRSRLKAGQFDSAGTGPDLARQLTEAAQAISKDKHLRVRFHPTKIAVNRDEPRPPTPEELLAEKNEMRRENGGFEKVERLAGNVGYIDFRFFGNHEVCFEAALSAMRFVQNTDALIIDVRKNGGGSPSMVAFVCSFLFDEPVHLNDLYFRPKNETRQFWTLPSLPVERYVNKPVFVLTSSYTFSGAEEFSYNLRNLNRATIVGETTGGGAHPGGARRISDHFSAFIPIGRAINPITKTNWEGTGVEPHVKVKADDALKTAHVEAVKKLLASAKSESDKKWLEGVLAKIQ